MPNFVEDDLPLGDPKTDLAPLPTGADPTKYLQAADWEEHRQYLGDIKAHLRSAERVTASGAVSPTARTTFVAGDVALTLADGPFEGFRKDVAITAGTGDLVPASFADGSSITWSSAPASFSLVWDATVSTWRVVGTPIGAAVKPVVNKLVFIIGDSNGAGNGVVGASDIAFGLANPYPNVQLAAKRALSQADPPVWIETALGDLQPFASSGAGMGIELTMGRTLYEQGMPGVAIGKMAIWGSALKTNWLPTASYPSSGPNLFSQWVTYARSLETLTGQTLGAVVVSLGSNDASDATLAARFAADMSTLASAIRAEFGPDVIIVVWEVSSSAVMTYTATVRAAQEAYVARDPKAVLVKSDDIPMDNGIHYFASGYATVGQRAAFKILDAFDIDRRVVTSAEPAFVGCDGAVTGAGALTPRSWAGVVDGDKEILAVTTGTQDVDIALSDAQGFTLIGSVARATYSTTIFQRLALFARDVVASKLVDGRMPSPTVQDTNDQLIAKIFTFRGSSGPMLVGPSQTSANTNASTSLTLTGITTLSPNNLVLMVVGAQAGSPQTISIAHDGLTSVTEQADGWYGINSERPMLSLTTGTKAAAGATGNGTGTITGATIAAALTVALEP